VAEHKRLEIGWTWIGSAHQRTGANREAKLLQLTHAFETLDANRVEFKTHSRNVQSRTALRGIGATFEGHISGATRAGLFVKLDDTGADGFIPARTIGEEYFRYHEDRHALIGDRSGETYRLGDRVTVRLVEAAPVAGALRF